MITHWLTATDVMDPRALRVFPASGELLAGAPAARPGSGLEHRQETI